MRGGRKEEEEEEAILGRRVFIVKSQRWNLAWGVKEIKREMRLVR